MRTLLILAMSMTVACNSSCGGATQTVERQTPTALACLPTAVVHVEACLGQVGGARTSCILIAAVELLSCWTTHQPAPASSPPTVPAGGSATVNDTPRV